MATGWSNLPGDILSAIAKRLDTDVDVLRFRSVCSSWRSSLSPPKKRFSFPLRVPPLRPSDWCRIEDRDGYFVLKENTIFRLSPPADGDRAGDTSGGWLFKVSEISPNRFCLLNPLIYEKMKDTEGIFPKTLNLLDYRISEICKSYSLDYVDIEEFPEKQRAFVIRKVIVLLNYVTGCDFVAMILPVGKGIDVWKFGDDGWTHMDVEGRYFHDVIQYGGKCYGIDMRGQIVYFDSSLNMNEVCLPVRYLQLGHNFLAKCDSDLYVVSKIDTPDPEYYYDIDEGEHLVDVDTLDVPLKVRVFKVSKELESGIITEFWDDIENLEDKVFFLADDVSVGVSAKDFAVCKGNYICLNDECFYDEGNGGVYGEDNGVYDFDDKIIEPFVKAQEYAQVFWPPPSWLMHGESSAVAFDF